MIDPSLELSYFSFLGGTGSDSASSVAVDSHGYVYLGGTTTSARTIPGASSTGLGPDGGPSDYFIAKIDPTKSGPASLVYLTFIGGSGAESGGAIALDSKDDVVIVGTTLSYDYPVTDGSHLTSGTGGTSVNDVAVTEIDPTGATLLYSTLFGGNGNEAAVTPGGVAISSSGEIFVAMDTQSTNLPVAPAVATDINGNVTAGPFQGTYGGGSTDGFLAVFNPAAAAGTSAIVYCTYLGIYGQPTVSGVAVDSEGNAYLAGYTNNPFGSFLATNGFQTTYGGDPYDAFVMKILPSGFGPQDLSYGTFLGGSGSDQALAIAVSTSLPGTVYVTGATQSTNFPVNGQVAPFQPLLSGSSNAFLAVIAQNPETFATSLLYSSYLGGTETDSGQSVFFSAQNKIFVAGSTNSWNFPWSMNLQPFEGTTDAFVAELDPTSPGSASLIYATPLGGILGGSPAAAHANAVAVSSSGNGYIAGDTNSSDFPRASNPGNGFQQICQSCGQSPSLSDAFLVGFAASAASQASVSFNMAAVNFGAPPLGSSAVPQAVAVRNTGTAALTISAIGVSGAANSDFTITDGGNCLTGPVEPGAECGFEIGFSPSMQGTETGILTLTDDGAGSPQALPLTGVGTGGLAATPAAINFGSVPSNPVTPAQMSVQLMNTGAPGSGSLSPTILVQGSSAFNFNPSPGSNSCSSISVGVPCLLYVTFDPTAAGSFTGQLVITYPWPGIGTAQTIVSLSGTSSTGTPAASVQPANLSFPQVGLGAQSPAETITVSNPGSAPLTFAGASISGANSGNFAIASSGGGSCPLSGGTLPTSTSCSLAVTFSSTKPGTFSATLNISDNASGSPQSVALQATAVAIAASLSTNSVAFGTATIGLPTPAVPVTLTNSGSSPLAISAISVTGADHADFTVPNNCPSSLAAAASCLLSVSFNPTQSGARSANIQISDNAPQSPQSIAVSGTAVQAQISVTPPSASFPAQLAGTPSSPQTFTITNTAAAPALLAVSSAVVASSTDFSVVKNGCSAPVSASGTCTISVQFDPSATAPSPSRSGTLVIQSNAPSSPVNVALTGTAEDFELGPATSGGTSLTVSAGTTATFNLDLTSIGGFSGTVALSCSGTSLPGTCAVTPSSITAASNAQTAFQVSIPTSADAKRASIFAFAKFGERPGSPAFIFRWIVLLTLISRAAAVRFVYATQFRRTRSRVPKSHVANFSVTKFRVALATIALCAAIAAGLAACGSGAASDPPDSPPTTTYSITVTAIAGTGSNSATRTLPLTLTVDQMGK